MSILHSFNTAAANIPQIKKIVVHVLKHLKRTRDKSANFQCSLGRAVLARIPKTGCGNLGAKVVGGKDWELPQHFLPRHLLRISSRRLMAVGGALQHSHSVYWSLSPQGVWWKINKLRQYFPQELSGNFRANQAGWGREASVRHSWSRSWHSWHDTGVLHTPAWSCPFLSWTPAGKKQTWGASQAPSTPGRWPAASLDPSPAHRGWGQTGAHTKAEQVATGVQARKFFAAN